MIKLISWIYNIIFGYKCNCCKKYVNSALRIKNNNDVLVILCYKCLGVHDCLSKAMSEMCKQLEAQIS